LPRLSVSYGLHFILDFDVVHQRVDGPHIGSKPYRRDRLNEHMIIDEEACAEMIMKKLRSLAVFNYPKAALNALSAQPAQLMNDRMVMSYFVRYI
jgi:hypothetical protein